MNVSIIGGGYVGMAWAYILLKNKNNVTIIDVDQDRIDSIKKNIKTDFCDIEINDMKVVLGVPDDCMHLLLKEEQTAAYTVEIWKRFRKWGGIPTGLTQNVKDLLASKEVENIFENSDFVM